MNKLLLMIRVLFILLIFNVSSIINDGIVVTSNQNIFDSAHDEPNTSTTEAISLPSLSSLLNPTTTHQTDNQATNHESSSHLFEQGLSSTQASTTHPESDKTSGPFFQQNTFVPTIQPTSYIKKNVTVTETKSPELHVSTTTPTTPTQTQTQTPTTSTVQTNYSLTPRPRSKNYASSECAKIVDANSEAEKVHNILNEMIDEYMLNPCNARVWFVVELCESIQPTQIEIANYELFSSTLKDFSIFFSSEYPSNDWSRIGQFTASDSRKLQGFPLSSKVGFGKFLKFELHSHYGNQHYCPISSVKVYGDSMVDEYENENKDFSPLDENPDKLDDGTETESTLPALEPKVQEKAPSLLNTAKTVVAGIINKIISPSESNKSDEKSSFIDDSSNDLVRFQKPKNLCFEYTNKISALAVYYMIMTRIHEQHCPRTPILILGNQSKSGFGSGNAGDSKKVLKTIKPSTTTNEPLDITTMKPTPQPQSVKQKPSVFVELSNKVKALESSLRLQREDFQNKLDETQSKLNLLEEQIQDMTSYAYIFCAFFVAYLTFRIILDFI